MQACQQMCEVLIEAGIDHVFGIPGGGVGPLFNAIHDHHDKIRFILTRHEQAASIMADVYGRLTGKPGVVLGQGVFIGSSAAFGIMEAFMSSSPMIALTDTSEAGIFAQHGSYQGGTGEHGAVDLPAIFKAITKYTTYATTPKEAVQGLQLAIKHAVTGRPGPTCVLLRRNAVVDEVDLDAPPRVFPTKGYLRGAPQAAPEEDVEQALQLLMQAEHPAILAGNGVHMAKAYGELRALAEFLGSPVATSAKGKSTFPEDHPLAAGLTGTFGQKVANALMSEADVLLVVGCKLSPNTTRRENPDFIDPSRQRIIQIDIDPRNAGWIFPTAVNLVGDARAVLSQVVERARRLDLPRHPQADARRTTLQQRKHANAFFQEPELFSDAVPILPQRLIRVLNEAIDPSAIVTTDAGKNRLFMIHHFQPRDVGTMLVPGGIAGMGWAPPAAVAAKLLHPERTCVSMSSDGGFAMSLHVLSTALQYHAPTIFVVMNDSALGWVRDDRLDRPQIAEYIDTDFAAIARGFGCEGIRVKKPQELRPAIEKAKTADVPTVIDVVVSREESYRKVASP
ncbi:MAG: thiamine pyrophosphate-binding protein [Nitrospinae bacterium]|nr:thiamine pyrophosphate-binding protein [Nitrospinota bacterium]